MQGHPGSAIRGAQQNELAVYSITDRDTVVAIPKGHAVVKSFGLRVGELKLPVLAAILSLVDAGLLAGTGSQNKGRLIVKGLDITEVEVFSAGNWQLLPEIGRASCRERV